MSQCDCRDCNCTFDWDLLEAKAEPTGFKVGDRVEVKYLHTGYGYGTVARTSALGTRVVVSVDHDDGEKRHHFVEYVAPLPEKTVAHRGEYDLDSIVGRVFYHDEENVRLLLNRATTWIKRNDLTLMSIKFDNSTEGGRYSESVTVIGERP